MKRGRAVLAAVLVCAWWCGGALVAEERTGIVRSRELVPDIDSIIEATEPGSVLPLRLFDDFEVSAVLDRATFRKDLGLVWHGHLAENPHGWVLLVVDGTVVSGHIDTGDRSFRVVYRGRGRHAIEEISRDRHFEAASDAVGVQAEVTSATVPPLVSPATPENPATVDVLIVYTDRARDKAGGDEAIQSTLRAWVASANLYLENSGVPGTFRLVKAGSVDYEGSGDLSVDLNRLHRRKDENLGRLVHRWRKKFGADLVTLVVHRAEGNYDGRWGYGFIGNPLMRGASIAFSVLYDDAPGRVLAHEWGHNLGLHHNRESASTPPPVHPTNMAFPFAFGYGHCAMGVSFETIMASALCRGLSVPYFSTPDREHSGVPLGVPGRDPDHSANAGKALTYTMPLAEQYYPCEMEPCQEIASDSYFQVRFVFSTEGGSRQTELWFSLDEWLFLALDGGNRNWGSLRLREGRHRALVEYPRGEGAVRFKIRLTPASEEITIRPSTITRRLKAVGKKKTKRFKVKLAGS